MRGPVFDLAKLGWLNGQHIRALDADAFMDRVAAWALNHDALAPLAPLLQTRTERLNDLLAQVDYLLGDRAPIAEEDFAGAGLDVGECKRMLHHAALRLDEIVDWQRAELRDALQGLATSMEAKLRDLVRPLFIAIAGRTVALPLFDSMAYLGRDLVRARLRSALTALGGISKKEARRLEKDYRSL